MEVRKRFEYCENQPLEIIIEGEMIRLRKIDIHNTCTFCGDTTRHMTLYKERWICQKCENEIRYTPTIDMREHRG